MIAGNGAKSRGRFRRVSKARILDGHPFRPGMHAILVMVVTYILITSAISFFFSYFHQINRILVLWTIVPGALLGFTLLVLERAFGLLKNSMQSRCGPKDRPARRDDDGV